MDDAVWRKLEVVVLEQISELNYLSRAKFLAQTKCSDIFFPAWNFDDLEFAVGPVFWWTPRNPKIRVNPICFTLSNIK